MREKGEERRGSEKRGDGRRRKRDKGAKDMENLKRKRREVGGGSKVEREECR